MITFLPQSDWIRQNCATQMERVRDNYNGYKGIRQYGTSQLHSAREQYYEQVRHQSAHFFGGSSINPFSKAITQLIMIYCLAQWGIVRIIF